jgi:D-arabinose 1-dehydrogenase-like Zn-dependent alcohol dehydrogenase
MLIGANSVSRNADSSESAASATAGLRQFPRSMLMRALTIKGIIVGSRRMLQNLVTAVDQHQIQPVIDRVFEFEQAPQAVSYMESGGTIGKIVIRVA